MKKTVLIALTTFVLGAFLCAFLLLYLPENKSETQEPVELNPASNLNTTLLASPPPQAKPDLDFVRVAEKVGPAVVKIEAERVEKRKVLGFWGEPDPFEDWWDRFFGLPREREQEFRSRAQGTGFCIDTSGHILTNHHIVENAVKVTVYTPEGEELKGKVIGTDPRTDLALIKVEEKNLPYVELGDSAKLKVGEWVLAIGNPFGLEHTVTAGIVSAKGRQLGLGLNVPQYQDFIQTDAAINRGNSGGPLVNLKGEVIGITSNILSPSGGNIGIGFAIPSNLAKKVVKQLVEKGRVIRGFLGIIPADINEDMMKMLNLKSKNGAIISEVSPGTPADKAGFKPYDVIVEVNGEPVKNENDLRFKIADLQPGTKVKIKVIRKGKEIILTPTIAELEPAEGETAAPATEKDIGLEVIALTPQLARRYGYRTQEGLLVTRVKKYSEAEQKNIAVGDIIIEVNQKKVTSKRELENIIKRTKSGEAILLLIRRERNGASQDYIVTLRIP
ncbi:MAG: DegQ family serine endoprotease [Candidatus Aminicenantales bacterium]